MIFFRFANYELSSILLDGPFPNYKRVIPENQPNKFGLDRAEFLSAIRRISIMIDKKVGRIYLNITPGVLKIYSQETDIGDAKEELGESLKKLSSLIMIIYNEISFFTHIYYIIKISFIFLYHYC